MRHMYLTDLKFGGPYIVEIVDIRCKTDEYSRYIVYI